MDDFPEQKPAIFRGSRKDFPPGDQRSRPQSLDALGPCNIPHMFTYILQVSHLVGWVSYMQPHLFVSLSIFSLYKYTPTHMHMDLLEIVYPYIYWLMLIFPLIY